MVVTTNDQTRDAPAHDGRMQPGAGEFSALVLIPAFFDVTEYERRWREGLEPDATPYGFHYAREFGVDVVFSRHSPSARSIPRRIGNKVLGIDVPHAIANRKAIAGADVVWTMLERDTMAAALLMKTGMVTHRPIVGSVVWLANIWDTLSAPYQLFYRTLMKQATLLLVHAEPCVAKMQAIVPETPVELLHFGISDTTFAHHEDKATAASGDHVIRIVAAGNDKTRDWQTLIEAFGSHPRFHLTIVCPWLDPALVAPHANIATPSLDGTAELATYYRAADIVAVPMVENLFSGITVALEAAAMGTTILSTRTGGVPTYFGESEAIFVPARDPVAMREKVLATSAAERAQIATRARQRFLSEDYTSRGMIRRYTEKTSRILAG